MAWLRKKTQKIAVLTGLLAGMVFCFGASVSLGTYSISLHEVVQAFIHFDPGLTEHILVIHTRLPRAVTAMLVGGSLGVSGAFTQALTRNPLASPSILGINSGAVFFAVLASSFAGSLPAQGVLWAAFVGAALSAVCVYVLGSVGRDGLTPVKIVLAGSAITALFSSFTQGILVLSESGIRNTLSWLAGGFAGRDMKQQMMVIPYMAAGMLLALLLSVPVNILSSGDEVAKGLGQRTVLVKIMMGVSIILLAGSSVAAAGSISFVGLVIPHLSRNLIGQDHRWIIPYSAVLGAALLLCADILARFIVMPSEAPVGVMTALIGAPFFIYIARKGGKGRQ
ncbi:iron ABC transporter permease [Clostridium boliviensis]|uniref:Iron ABC transporter permease n=1 Tax=Clostridium boliviensis TaxID=318465 RepID=A0ABU4GI93_9CLOT|nr:iron ABC transporter permease [Clostridium boliviensis]MDW2797335.1 iron ABC transporter permease [Clostridium boliviensis]